MFLRKCVGFSAMALGCFLLMVSWISWWLCKDTQSALCFVGFFITGGIGAHLWNEN